MGILERFKRKTSNEVAVRDISTVDEYIAALQYSNFNSYQYQQFQQTLTGEIAEQMPNDLTAYATRAYGANGPIFALIAVRMQAFSSIRFQFQRINGGRPSGMFGTPDLSLLESPYQGGTTQDLLARILLDVDLAGNAYVARMDGELIRLRPDWVQIVLEPRKNGLGYRCIGYIYQNGGFGSAFPLVPLLPADVAHFAPYPDPLATYRGISWLTPVIRELVNDRLMTTHQTKFFENGATPNMLISMDSAVSFDDFKRFKEQFKLDHEGVQNAYKTLVLGGGADATVVGANFEQMSFTATQGRIETRLASAARVPAVIVGFSEGLQGSSLNAGNFREARKELADMTMHPLWANLCGSLQHLVMPTPGNGSVRLWYDGRDIPFLREDAKDAADIQMTKASTINQLVQAGFEAESVKEAVNAEDFSLLKHTGLFSVQLQPPMTDTPIPQPIQVGTNGAGN